MMRLRTLIRDNRALALLLLVAALCLKAAVPAGYMVAGSADTVFTVTICADAGGPLKTKTIVVPGKPGLASSQHDKGGHDGEKASHCAFTSLAKAALGGADAILLALAFAAILVLGLAPTRTAQPARLSQFLPPLRGPPAAA